MKTKLKALTTLMGILIFFSFTGIDFQNSDWKVPEEAAKVKNPYTVDKEGLAIGKQLYAKHCRSCHGKEGLGDGTKAEELEDYPGDFTSAEFKNQTDGALFYKLSVGRDEMPEFVKKIPSEEDRWLVVAYMKTL